MTDVLPGTHEALLARALELAALGRYSARPNPMVGCVIARDGLVIAEGFHVRAGEAHAEINALAAAGDAAKGADLYCTLEPCNHVGRTGPCTEAIIRAQVGRVIIGAGDPNPQVDGAGVARLREAGIEVIEGVLEARCTALNEVFNHWITRGVPWVTLKLASSLDGRIAASPGNQTRITGDAAQRRVHALRAACDAVLVGSRTVSADNPQLTAREVTPLTELAGPIDQPRAIVVDSLLRTPNSARVFARPGTIVATALDESELAERRGPYAARGAQLWSVGGVDGRVDMARLMARLGALRDKPVTSVLVEGGGEVAASFIGAGLVNRWLLHVGGKVLGSAGVPSVGAVGPEVHKARWRLVGTRLLGEGDTADVELEVRPCLPG